MFPHRATVRQARFQDSSRVSSSRKWGVCGEAGRAWLGYLPALWAGARHLAPGAHLLVCKLLRIMVKAGVSIT